ncbi:MAG: sigma-70 family RNA polymerase sigma factor [Myxococcales bacterium]|nr:sigma-70 family RNA polymerase sigma factor [Myxococcales bacterium]
MSLDGAAESVETVESRALLALAAGDREQAATLMLREHGPEVSRFLAALHRDPDDAAEVFSAFAEALWKSVASFEGRSSVRTWMFAVARRVSLRYRRDERRRRKRFQPLPEGSALLAVEAQLRTATLSFLKTERRSKLTALRESLPVEDQMLLMLRVDRKLAWNELAVVLSEAEGDDDVRAALAEDAQKREAARLRKKFQLLKERLRELGRREGLIGGDDTQ